MTRMVDGFEVYTYEEWVKERKADFLENEEEGHHPDCPTCDGEGDYECPECGSIIDCKDCDGTGVIEDEWVPEDSHKIYEAEVVRDIKALKRYRLMMEGKDAPKD